MAPRIVSADERLSNAGVKTTMAIFGPSGVGKTSLLKTLPAAETLCIDLEAGMKSVQDWPGDSIPIRTFADALDIGCLVGGVSPSADPTGFFSEGHYQHLSQTFPDLVRLIGLKRIIFVNSITDLTRQAMAWAKTRPEAYSEKTGKPDTRGAYGLLARETIGLLKHLQHAPGRTVIFVGILERVTDEFNRITWQPQMEGGKAARELPGIVDQVITMSLFAPEGDGFRHEPERGEVRRLVCRAGNPFALPAKDRSGRLDLTEPPDLGALLSKINLTRKGWRAMSFDMNDAEPQKSGELIPDGTFAKVTMTIRPGGIDGQSEVDQALLKAPKDPTSDVRMLDCEFTVVEGPHARRKFWQMFTVQGGKVDESGVSIGWKISKSTFRAMIDSALGLDPQDMSEAAKKKRILRGLADLNNITFIAKIKIEPSEDARYGDQNRLDRVVLPTDKEWKLVMDGKDVPASPSRSRGAGNKAAATQPAWTQATGQGGQPAAAQSRSPQTSGAPAWSQPSSGAGAPAAKPPGPAWLNG